MKKVTIILILLTVFISCSKDKIENYTGTYEGTFSGDEKGSIVIVIENDGTANGHGTFDRSVNPNISNRDFDFSGKVNDAGTLVCPVKPGEFSIATGGAVTGLLNSKNGAGEWRIIIKSGNSTIFDGNGEWTTNKL